MSVCLTQANPFAPNSLAVSIKLSIRFLVKAAPYVVGKTIGVMEHLAGHHAHKDARAGLLVAQRGYRDRLRSHTSEQTESPVTEQESTVLEAHAEQESAEQELLVLAGELNDAVEDKTVAAETARAKDVEVDATGALLEQGKEVVNEAAVAVEKVKTEAEILKEVNEGLLAELREAREAEAAAKNMLVHLQVRTDELTSNIEQLAENRACDRS